VNNVGQLQKESLRLGEEIANQRLQLQQQNEYQQTISQLLGRLNDFLYGNAQQRGAVGEQIVREQLRLLPAEWIAHNVRFAGNLEVEFALRAPNGKLLPIDSKWTAEHLLSQLNASTDLVEKNQLRKQICREVMERAIEVRKYLEPRRTMGFAIAAVPDGVFESCRHIQPVLAARDVVLLSYSLLLPYLLLLVHTMMVTVETAEMAEVAHAIQRTQLQMESMYQELDKMNPLINALGNVLQADAGLNDKLATAHDQMRVIEAQLAEVSSHLPNQSSLNYIGDLAALRTDLQSRLEKMRTALLSFRGGEG
jgi:DNA recombination protein RmuC